MKHCMSMTLLAALLAACSAKVTPPGVELETVPLKVEVGKQSDTSNGKFCPPGQAKKGRC